jgi:probable F420-dependent oxidoreductase
VGFGVLLPNIGPLATGPEALSNFGRIAAHAEELGFDSLWVADHIVIPTAIHSIYPYSASGEFPADPEQGMLDPLVTLGYLAAVTKRPRLGTWVLVLPHRNPIVTAKMFATLDVLAEGRIIMGAGVGWLEEEIRLLGAPFDQRGKLADEYIRAFRELWTNPDPSFEGEYCSFEGFKCEPKPVQDRLPVWVGGHSARAMRRVAELGDGWLASANSVERFQQSYSDLEAAAEVVGRDVATIDITITPNHVFTVDTFLAEVDTYRSLGFESFLAPVPLWTDNLPSALSIMDDFATSAGMR